jgi:ribonucleoside-diphosphate reductase subunit M2
METAETPSPTQEIYEAAAKRKRTRSFVRPGGNGNGDGDDDVNVNAAVVRADSGGSGGSSGSETESVQSASEDGGNGGSNGDSDAAEPLLTPSSDRLVFGGRCRYPEFRELYLTQQNAFWRSDEIDWSTDRTDWETKLSDAERRCLEYVFVYFSRGDGIVGENLAMRFYNEVQDPWLRAFYAAQLYIETEHARTYTDLILALIGDATERERLFDAVETLPAAQRKLEWAQRWTHSAAPFGERVVAWACIEGIHFSFCFLFIFWMRKRGLLPGVCRANDLISRDEGMHRNGGCLVVRRLVAPPSHARIAEIIQGAVDVELEFVRAALPAELAGMNAETAGTYVRFVADTLARDLGMPALYNVANPFPWMDLIALEGKSNFFEVKPTEYQHRTVRRQFSTTAML